MFVRSLNPYPFVSLFREGEGGEGGGGGAGGGGGTGQKPEKPVFDAAQQQYINDLLAAERKNAEERTEQRLKDEATAAETQRQQEADRQAAEAKGEFETVKTSLISERDGFKTERDAYKSDLDAAYRLLEAQAETLKGELPAELLDGFPETGSPVERITWLQGRKQVFEVAKAATGANGQHPRVPSTPAAQGNVKPDIREALKGIRYT